MPLIIGGATAGGMFLAVILIFVVILLRRYRKHGKLLRLSFVNPFLVKTGCLSIILQGKILKKKIIVDIEFSSCL